MAEENSVLEKDDETIDGIKLPEDLVSPTKLTNWKNEPSVSDLKQDLIDSSMETDSHNQDVDRWLSNMFITGSAKPKKVIGRSAVQPKLIRKQAEWRYPGLSEPFLSTDDIFNVEPKTAGDTKRAKQNQLVLNNQFNTQINKIKFIDDYVRDAVDIGTVIVEVGWLSEVGEKTETIPTYDYYPGPPKLAEQYVELSKLRASGSELYEDFRTPGLDVALDSFEVDGIPLYPEENGGTEEVISEVQLKNQPTVEVCESANIIIDPSCNGDIDKAKFVAKKFKSSKSDLRADGRYKNISKIDVEGANPLTDEDYQEGQDNQSFNFNDEPRKQFVVHSYYGEWDIYGTGIVISIIAAWVGDVMIRMELNPFPDKRPPFVTAQYMPKRKSVYGEPDGELLEDNQKVSGAIKRGIVDLLGKSANSQTGMRKDMLDVTNMRKFMKGDNYQFNAGVDPGQGVYTHKFPEIPQSAYNMIIMENNEAESLTGTKAFSSGITGASLGPNVGSGKSALDAAAKREVSILRRLAGGVTQIGRKILAMNSEFLSEEEVIRVTAEEFVTVRRDDLAGNFDLRLTISTPEEDEAKAQELAFMLQTNGPNGDPGEVRLIRAKIAELRKMPDLAKQIREYQPTPDPLAVAKAELEIKLLEAQIAKEQALTAKHASEADVNVAREYKEGTQGDLNASKAGTEGAKARNLHSDSDNKDLNFIEQESGVHQEREKELLDKKNASSVEKSSQGNKTKQSSRST